MSNGPKSAHSAHTSPQFPDESEQGIGGANPRECNASCNSRPFNPGICISVIRHVVSAIALDWRKCSAELKVTPWYPNDSTSSHMPSRASASSSTIEISGALALYSTTRSRNIWTPPQGNSHQKPRRCCALMRPQCRMLKSCLRTDARSCWKLFHAFGDNVSQLHHLLIQLSVFGNIALNAIAIAQ